VNKISLKTKEEIAIMAEGGEALSEILWEALRIIKAGISTLEIDSFIDKKIVSFGGIPAFKKVPGYFWASCIGVNNEVVHSIPKKEKILKEGDLLKIDLGMNWRGFNTDLSWTTCVDGKGKKCDAKKNFLQAGKRALDEAIGVARAGNRVGHISQTIEKKITEAGYNPVKVLTGHGIGRKLHEEPMIPGILKGRIEDSPKLIPGMTLAIEVIYNEGESEVVLGDDNWTILTKDGKISGLFEKTIAIAENKPLILTPFNETKERD